eukprot:1160685-Pelagomonas_calceolata.AAC.3
MVHVPLTPASRSAVQQVTGDKHTTPFRLAEIQAEASAPGIHPCAAPNVCVNQILLWHRKQRPPQTCTGLHTYVGLNSVYGFFKYDLYR